MGGVDHDPHAVEREVAGEGGLGEDDVAPARVLELLGAADAGAGLARAEQRSRRAMSASISASASSGSLKPSPPKILMPLSSYGLWLALITMPASARMLDREVRDRRRRDRAAEHHAPAHRADAGGERGLEHVAREARVLADDDARRVALAAAGDEGRRRGRARGPARASWAARWRRRGCRRCRRGCASRFARSSWCDSSVAEPDGHLGGLHAARAGRRRSPEASSTATGSVAPGASASTRST